METNYHLLALVQTLRIGQDVFFSSLLSEILAPPPSSCFPLS